MFKVLLNSTDTIRELLVLYLCILLTCASVISVAEGIGLLDAVWFSFVTATSVGYGDFTAKTVVGRVTSVLLMHVSLFFIAPMIVGHIIKNVLQDRNAFTHEEQEEILEILRQLRRPPALDPSLCKVCRKAPRYKGFDHCGGDDCVPF